MINNRFRIYYGPQDNFSAAPAVVDTVEPQQPARQEKTTVTVSASELFQILSDAIESSRAWLQDFEDDEVTISSDLHEVMLAYQHIRRPSA